MTLPAVIRLDTTDSTQDLLHQLAAEGAPAGTAVVARRQSGGRGSRGRAWISPAGGLWLSVLCRPQEAPGLEVLSLRVGLLMAEALERRCPGIQIGLKWPNDLQLGQRKLGGVLCEARWHGGEPAWVAVGLGLNVQNPVPDDLEATAIALASVVRRIGPTELEGDAITAIVEAGDRSGALTPRELAAYAVRDSLLGRQLLAPVAGVARGVGADGALLVEAGASGIRAIRSGKVQLVGG